MQKKKKDQKNKYKNKLEKPYSFDISLYIQANGASIIIIA